MKKKISLLAALLICAGCLWAAMPKTVHFAGRTYYFSKINEDGLYVFKTTDRLSSFIIDPVPTDSPKNTAEQLCKALADFFDECQIVFCSPDDVLVQAVSPTTDIPSTKCPIILSLTRFIKQGAFSVVTEAEHPLSEYRRALCQFPLDTLSE